jgi:hypothetical protein
VELLKNAADMNLTHVPYKGAAPALQAVLAGEPSMMLDVTVAVIPHVKSGKLRALMVTGGKPLDQLPGAVPFDSLFPGLGIPGWHGIFTAGGTPKPVLDKLAADIRQVLQTPAVGNRFRELGVSPPASPATPSTKSSGDLHAGAKSSSRTSWGGLAPPIPPPHLARPALNPAAVSSIRCEYSTRRRWSLNSACPPKTKLVTVQ